MLRSSCLIGTARQHSLSRRQLIPQLRRISNSSIANAATAKRTTEDDHNDANTIHTADESSPPLSLLGAVAKRRVAARLLAQAQQGDDIAVRRKDRKKVSAEEARTDHAEATEEKLEKRRKKRVEETQVVPAPLELEDGNHDIQAKPEYDTYLPHEEMPKAKRKQRTPSTTKDIEHEITTPKPLVKRKSSKKSIKAKTELVWDLGETVEDPPETALISPSANPSVPAKSEAEMTIDEQMEKALDEWKIPDTDLAKHVFRNTKRFPDCIVLTRVGKFYEVNPPCPPSLVLLKLPGLFRWRSEIDLDARSKARCEAVQSTSQGLEKESGHGRLED